MDWGNYVYMACPEWESNPHWNGFEPFASAGWAIGAGALGYRL